MFVHQLKIYKEDRMFLTGNIGAIGGSCACFRLLQTSGLFYRPLCPFYGEVIFCVVSVDFTFGL